MGQLTGKYKGRKSGSTEPVEKFLSKPKVKKVKMMLEQGMGIRTISSIVDCSTNFVYKVKEKLVA